MHSYYPTHTGARHPLSSSVMGLSSSCPWHATSAIAEWVEVFKSTVKYFLQYLLSIHEQAAEDQAENRLNTFHLSWPNHLFILFTKEEWPNSAKSLSPTVAMTKPYQQKRNSPKPHAHLLWQNNLLSAILTIALATTRTATQLWPLLWQPLW